MEELIHMFALAYPDASEAFISQLDLDKFRATAKSEALVQATKVMFADPKYAKSPPSLQELRQAICAVGTSRFSYNVDVAGSSAIVPSPAHALETPREEVPDLRKEANVRAGSALGCWRCGSKKHEGSNCPYKKVL